MENFMINNRLRAIRAACKNSNTNLQFLTSGSCPWRGLLKTARYRAKVKGIPFDLDDAWARDRYTGCCEISGLPFATTENKRTLDSMSLDQINPGAGYTKYNCRFILWGINAMLGDTGNLFGVIRIARAIHLKHKGKV